MTIYLYVKTHSKTGLKYLGKTVKDPFTYLGSGIDWKAHLKIHGVEHTTEIIKECNTNAELNKWGRYYSKLWNIVESNEWANRIPETGGGSCSPESAKKISEKLKGIKKPSRTDEHKEKLSASLRGKANPKTSIGLRQYYNSTPDRSKAIDKQSKSLIEWYKNNSELSHQKSLKSWDCRYKNDYEKYKSVILIISKGKNNCEIAKMTSVDFNTIKKLRTGNHRLFELFPELKVILGS